MDRKALAARNFGRSSVVASMDSVACPKPRRLGGHCRPPFGRQTNAISHTESSDLKAGTELLDIIGAKGCCAPERFNSQVSSPSFYCGSPPSRVSNPIVQDENFGIGGFNPKSPVSALPTSPSTAREGGYARMKFGQMPALVRIEGFNCLAQERQNCSVFAVA